MRAKLSPTFTSGKMKMMFETVSKVSDGMIDYLKPTADEEGCIEMKEVLSSFTTEGENSKSHKIYFFLSQVFHSNLNSCFRLRDKMSRKSHKPI